MPRFLRTAASFLGNLVRMPGRVKRMEEAVRSLLYMQAMSSTHPEVLARVAAPRPPLSEKALEELHGWYERESPINTYCQTQARVTTDLAARLSHVWSKEEGIALFQEAVALAPDSHKAEALRRYVDFLRRYALDPLHILEVMEQFKQMYGIWVPRFSRVWVIYIAALIHVGDHDSALKILKKYAAQYKNLRGLAEIVSVARFAHAHGFSCSLVEKAALVAEETEKNAELLETMLRGKNVAVVGNGPFERGRGRGGEIDAHDVVIRFNMAVPTQTDAVDYGQRTDIMVLNNFPDRRSTIPDYKMILLADGLERQPCFAATITLSAAAVKRGISKLTAVPVETHLELLRHGHLNPSSGLTIIAMVKSFNPGMRQASLYGFSHTQHEDLGFFGAKGQYHYAAQNYELSDSGTVHSHSLRRERECLRQLFAQTMPSTIVNQNFSKIVT